MYKMIIADDEKSFLSRIKRLPDIYGICVELVGEAEDGIEAIELFEALKPSIIIMDINMPSKNGLEVAGEIIKIDPDVKIIIITGYNEFEYAQNALKIGAFDLLTKPVEQSTIINAVKRACADLDEKREEKIKLDKIRNMVIESMPILREKFLKSLLEGELVSCEKAIKDKLSYLDLDIECNYYNTAVIITEINGTENMENDLLLFAVKNVTEEILSEADIKTFIYNGNFNNLIILLGNDDSSIPEKIDNIFAAIRDKLKFYLSVETYTGIGEETTSLENISESFRNACEALNYRNIFGRNNVVNIKNINIIENRRTTYSSRDIDDILESFKAGDIEGLDSKIGDVLNKVISVTMGNIEIVKRLFIELMAAIVRVCGELGIDDSLIYCGEDPYRKITTFSNIVELKNWILQVCGELIEILGEKRSRKVNRVVEMAKDYIYENYRDEDLNLKKVSDYVELSSVYFCQLFSQKTGMYFSDFINSVRIENAKELLRETVLKVYEIAYNVGYSNPKHFNMVFKKITGLTPVQYRNTADIID